jgi:2-C-methyl-D-erythritol 4-phosphate cytidylyltransferase
MKVVVIIPAAGLGTRMAPIPAGSAGKQKKAPPSKQFTELGGTPILIRTVRKFAAAEAVTEIWIALRENEVSGFRARLESEAKDVLNKRVEFVVGGEHRQQSV